MQLHLTRSCLIPCHHKTYAAAWALGNMYSIFSDDQIYQSGNTMCLHYCRAFALGSTPLSHLLHDVEGLLEHFSPMGICHNIISGTDTG